MSTVCKIILIILFGLYLAAAFVAFAGSRGLFWFEPDGLAAIYLVLIGLPWSQIAIRAVGDGEPSSLWRIYLYAVPLFTIGGIFMICRWRSRR